MSQRFQKIYTTRDLEDAHVLQSFMRRNGVPCWMLRSNGVTLDEKMPLAEEGYKLFVPADQLANTLSLVRNTFDYAGDAPFTGSLDLAFGGRVRTVPMTQLQDDPVGPEEFVWDPPAVGDLIGDAWKTGRSTCPKCGHEMGAGDNFCDSCGEALVKTEQTELPSCRKCGHDMPVGTTICPTCGEMQ